MDPAPEEAEGKRDIRRTPPPVSPTDEGAEKLCGDPRQGHHCLP